MPSSTRGSSSRSSARATLCRAREPGQDRSHSTIACGLLDPEVTAMGDFDRAVLGSADDPAKPAGMHPLGQVDARFTVSFESSVPAALLVMSQFFAALARRDV